MRTSVKLDDDVARAVEQLRHEQGLSTSGALNALARRGLAERDRGRVHFAQSTSSLGPSRIPLDDVGTALDVLEGGTPRVIIDANLLLYARNAADPGHGPARAWLEDALNGQTRVGLPWQSLTAFLRIATSPAPFPTR